MDLSDRNRIHLEMLRDIFEVSQGCSTRTYMWGGIVVDILRGKFTREHHDLDGFTLNLLDVLEGIQSGYESRGYAVQYDTKYQILKIEKGGEHASFNRLEVEGEMAMWRHVGDYGTIYFPEVWLDETPRRFYGELTLTSGVKFEYAIKKNVKVFRLLRWSISQQSSQQKARELTQRMF